MLGLASSGLSPKIRLGELQQEEICCQAGGRFQFVREPDPDDITKLTCTYEKLIDDVSIGDRILLADGTVSMRVTEKPPGDDRIVCVVEHSGCIRSRQPDASPCAPIQISEFVFSGLMLDVPVASGIPSM